MAEITKSKLWTREQLLVVLNLYCQLPFGKLHKGNRMIIEVAKLLGRTPDALAMKLTNIASLDPKITQSGRKGLSGHSKLDKALWEEFQENPEYIGYQSQLLMDKLVKSNYSLDQLSSDSLSNALSIDYSGENKIVNVQIRIKQSFFRKTVLSSYENSCCITGINDTRLLVASHIVPWSIDKCNRLNPRNGLCLSALHDKAYDRGLITITPDLKVRVSNQLKELKNNRFAQDYLLGIDNSDIRLPKRFFPSPDFLDYHFSHIFLQ